MTKSNNVLIVLVMSILHSTSYADALPHDNAHTTTIKPYNATLQLGWVNYSQDNTQHINISGLIGDDFASSGSNTNNGLVGIGYYPLEQSFNSYDLLYGINAFYLAHSVVDGTVTQENLYTNLAYSYSVTNWPIYFGIKSIIHIPKSDDRYNVTLDVGVGPDIVDISHFSESSLDGGITIPDSIFAGKTSASLTAMAGVGIKINHVFGDHPIECGYRFMYLGPANLSTVSTLAQNALNTGNNYANAVLCGVSF